MNMREKGGLRRGGEGTNIMCTEKREGSEGVEKLANIRIKEYEEGREEVY